MASTIFFIVFVGQRTLFSDSALKALMLAKQGNVTCLFSIVQEAIEHLEPVICYCHFVCI